MAGIALNTNLASLGAQRRLAQSSSRLGESYTRLASGLRINRASDDAAGLAIADSLRTGARLYTAAAKNINDGISLLSVVEGALSEQKNILIRLQELAAQSSNGVYEQRERDALQREYSALIVESGRIAATTEFNGRKLLSGDSLGIPQDLLLQAGITGQSASMLRVVGQNAAAFSGSLNINELSHTASSALNYFAERFGNEISLSLDEIHEQIGTFAFQASGRDSGGTSHDVLWVAMSEGSSSAVYFFGFVRDGADSNKWKTSIDVVDLLEQGDGNFFFNQEGQIDQDSLLALALDFDVTPDPFNLTSLRVTGIPENAPPLPSRTGTSALELTRIDSMRFARTAIDVIANRMSELSTMQGAIGAAQSRLSVAEGITLSSRENSSAAESRIRDVDVAEESAALVRNNILQQAGVAVLAQANQAPALAVTLLRNG